MNEPEVNGDHHRAADNPAANIVVTEQRSSHELFSRPTNAIFRKPAARSRFITSINSP